MSANSMSIHSDVPLLRPDLLAAEFRSSEIQHKLRSKQWLAPRRGIYVDTTADNAQFQRAVARAHLLRAGPGSALSHHSAAEVHQFDSTHPRPNHLWISSAHAKRMSRAEGLTFIRSRSLDDSEITVVDDMTITSRARTVLDLATIVDVVELERIIESAIRGADHRRPDRWRPEVLAQLERYAEGDHRRPGAAAVARCLHLRFGALRPAGSIAEVALIQALRVRGITDVIRQPRLRIFLANGKWTDIFPDLVLPSRRLIVEVDGRHHLDPTRHRADLARQNKLLVGFNLARYTAIDALFDSDRIAADVKSLFVCEHGGGPYSWQEGGRTVEGSDLEWTLRY